MHLNLLIYLTTIQFKCRINHWQFALGFRMQNAIFLKAALKFDLYQTNFLSWHFNENISNIIYQRKKFFYRRQMSRKVIFFFLNAHINCNRIVFLRVLAFSINMTTLFLHIWLDLWRKNWTDFCGHISRV